MLSNTEIFQNVGSFSVNGIQIGNLSNSKLYSLGCTVGKDSIVGDFTNFNIDLPQFEIGGITQGIDYDR